MDDQQSQDSQSPEASPDDVSNLSPAHPSSEDDSFSIPSGSLIAPISKEEAIRERILHNPHRITWTSEPVHDELDIPRYPFYQEPPPPPSTFSAWVLPILLFGLTVFTTLWAGALHVNTRPTTGAWDFLTKYPDSLLNGLPFSATLLSILVIHEFGHYVLARIHQVPTSFPLFIPGPPQFIGTFGAVIRMRAHPL